MKLDKDQIKNQPTITSCLWIECECIVFPLHPEVVVAVTHCKWYFSCTLFGQRYDMFIIMQILCKFCAIFCSRCSVQWAPGVPGSSNRSQKTNPTSLCGSQDFSLKTGCCSTTVQAFNTTHNLLLTQRGVCVRACVCACVRTFVCVCWRGTDRNLGVCSCHNEMSIFMTCCLLSGTCELFPLQTSASDFCTFILHNQKSRMTVNSN